MLSDILNSPAEVAAKGLLGSYLVRTIDGQEVIVKIVETEAYSQYDEASHSYRGPTKRTQIMFGKPGFAYVYFTYGMHYCLNIVTQPKGIGSAVLIRAVEPIKNIQLMRDNRPGIKKDEQLTNGPAKLTKALAIDKSLYGHDLSSEPLVLRLGDQIKDNQIITSTRIGISKGKDKMWRFYIKDNPYVSKV